MPFRADHSQSIKTGRGRYTSRACEECRRRRAKCDGGKPSCTRCSQRGLSCQYSGAEDGRKPAPKSYVLLLRERIDFLEDLLRKNGIDPNAATKLPVSGDRTEELLSSGQGANEHDSSTAMDELCGSFEGCLTLENSLNFDHDGEMRYFGPTSGRLQFPLSDAKEYGPFGTVSPPINISQDSAVAGGVPEELQTQLIDLFFTWEQPWSPILSEELFRSSMRDNGKYFSPLLLNCILAMGSRYLDDLSVRSSSDDPNSAGRTFLEKAKMLLHYEVERPNLTTIQSLHILGVAYHAMGADAAGWLHTGMANRLVLDMGLNMDPAGFADTLMSCQELELRRRIYWTLYCHDKLAAIYTGRICSFLDSQGAVNLPSDPFICALVRICQLLEKILLSLWGPKPLLRGQQRLPFLRSCLLQLRSWFYDLPPTLRIDQPNDLPHAYTLHMVYYTARILLAKRFLTGSNSTNQCHNSKTQASHLARSICSESARQMSVVAQKYRQRFGSFRLSPITPTHCSLSAALVLLEEVHRDGGISNRNALQVCMKVLEELSTAFTPACHILRSLQKLYKACQNTSNEKSEARSEQPQQMFEFPLTNSIFPWPGETPWLREFPDQSLPIFQETGLPTSDPLTLDLRLDSAPVDYDMFELLNSCHFD